MKNLDRKCPHCGGSWRKNLMEVDPEAPGPLGILRGEAGPFMRLLLIVALTFFLTMAIYQIRIWL